jgi:hypothetical protein
MGDIKLITVLTGCIMLVNFIFQNKHIPPILKSGIACPIYKKGGKPADNPNSYRKMSYQSDRETDRKATPTGVCRNTQNICKTQSVLQKVFTRGESLTIAVLIVTELFTEAIENNKSIFIALTCSKSI